MSPHPRHAVLLDDDELIHMTWRLAARKHAVELEIFSSYESMVPLLPGIPLDTPLYVDVSLQSGARGEDIAKDLIARGYREVYLTTGYDAHHVAQVAGVRAILGKTPPWA